ncbi:superoxide dismutase [Flavobacterium gilvum]|uniref:Superoxide dismutase n=1 Tax=Flavobacterium gilvum TaxID=1492737 RepID=A0AAC9I5N3_9FLAO|nr:superoxide dismutase [Flavobacterium gilvum]AOW10894.1 superoxide dismutase [Flavobacterium gilvum]KFC60159.1 superoxide dismutase [Flavobacterium gilvum]
MKKIVAPLLFISVLISCNDKKLTEVVEVPLPTVQEKVKIGNPDDLKASGGAFQLEKLPFGYEALTPNLSALTLESHYKNYLYYTNNLNKALVGTGKENLSIEDIITNVDITNPEIRNNAGGYYNHTLYFKCIAPNAGGEPIDTLASKITKDFGSFSNFKAVFKETANKQFGSGWVWLVVDKTGVLQLSTTQDQDNPLMTNAPVVGFHGIPILGIDLWEHAYFLDYQYKKKKYIDDFFNIVNWEKVNENYKATFKN